MSARQKKYVHANKMTDPRWMPFVSLRFRKEVLFLISHGAREYDLIFMHQFFSDRGANISFACVSTVDSEAIITRSFRPTYSISNCTQVTEIDFLLFDAYYSRFHKVNLIRFVEDFHPWWTSYRCFTFK